MSCANVHGGSVRDHQRVIVLCIGDGTAIRLCADKCMDTRIDMSIAVCRDMRTGMCIDVCIDVRVTHGRV